MTATGIATRGRTLAESVMVDACTITRPGTGDGTFDPDTGETVPPAPTTVYTGKCRVKSREVLGQDVPSGGQMVTLARYVVSVPITVTGVDVGDTVTVTTSFDPGGARALTVEAIEAATFVTARRLTCIDNEG